MTRSRRQFLRDVGISAAALPFVLNLPSLGFANQQARKQRLVVMFSPGGGVDLLPSRPLAPGDRMDLEAAIATLPKGARRVFTLHDIEGYKHEEIAEMLGVTSGATKAQLHRARLLLREALNR